MSRQDELHSYQFTRSRMVTALVTRQADPPTPLRRMAGLALAGPLVAGTALAVVAAYALLRPGMSTAWRSGDAIVVEKETGARYVHLAGVLHPVPNYASARLVLGSPTARVVTVRQAALGGVDRGPRLGIPGAPDSLPARGDLLTGAWTVCSNGGAAPGGVSAAATLYLGARPAGGRLLPPEAGLLVRSSDGTPALIWHGHRHRVPQPASALPALGWADQVPVAVAAEVLNTVPAGVDLARIGVAARGRRAWPGGPSVGTVFVIESASGNRRYAVAVPGGLAPVSQVQADLLLGDPDTVRVLGQRRPVPMAPGEYAAAPQATLPAEAAAGSGATGAGPPDPGAAGASASGGDLPGRTPALIRPTAPGRVCVTAGDPAAPVEVLVDVPLAGDAGVPAGAGRDNAGLPAGAGRDNAGVPAGAGPLRVVLPPGRGVAVTAVAAPGAPDGAVSLIVEPATRYPVPDARVLAVLGYPRVRPVRRAAALVAMLPSGPVLDPVAARTAAPAVFPTSPAPGADHRSATPRPAAAPHPARAATGRPAPDGTSATGRPDPTGLPAPSTRRAPASVPASGWTPRSAGAAPGGPG